MKGIGSERRLDEFQLQHQRWETLKESDVARMWQRLFSGQAVTADTFAKAEELVDELKPESPLRFRLAAELEDIRGLQTNGEKRRKKR